MKVFISWSGILSQKVAKILNDWLPTVIQSIKPFYSPEIEKGTKWEEKISVELDKSDFGIICLTLENTTADWLLFEAGALSKKVSKANVATLLIDLGTRDYQRPLAMFQATKLEKEDVFLLLQTINKKIGTDSLDEKTLLNSFNKWWPELETKISEAINSTDNVKPDIQRREDPEILEEILQNIREIKSDVVVIKASNEPLTLEQLRTNFNNLSFPDTGLLDEGHFLKNAFTMLPKLSAKTEKKKTKK